MGCPRVFLADNLHDICERVKELLQEDFDVVGSAQNGQEAVQAVALLNPDLLVLDISMPGLNGIQVVSRLRESGCRSKVVFLTVHEDQDYVEAAFSVGALGYVVKSRIVPDLIPALQSALRGREFTSVLRARAHSQSAPAVRTFREQSDRRKTYL